MPRDLFAHDNGQDLGVAGGFFFQDGVIKNDLIFGIRHFMHDLQVQHLVDLIRIMRRKGKVFKDRKTPGDDTDNVIQTPLERELMPDKIFMTSSSEKAERRLISQELISFPSRETLASISFTCE